MGWRIERGVWGMLALVGLVLSGCGSGQETALLSATVTVDGEPLAQAAVILEPASGLPIMATTDEAGKFSLKAPPGSYRVAISKTRSTARPGADPSIDDPGAFVTEYLSPSKYASTMTSGLTVDVKPGMETITWNLQP